VHGDLDGAEDHGLGTDVVGEVVVIAPRGVGPVLEPAPLEAEARREGVELDLVVGQQMAPPPSPPRPQRGVDVHGHQARRYPAPSSRPANSPRPVTLAGDGANRT